MTGEMLNEGHRYEVDDDLAICQEVKTYDANEKIGEEDEENNSYSLPDPEMNKESFCFFYLKMFYQRI